MTKTRTSNRSQRDLSRPAADPALWALDRRVTFLNHGSFGACPRRVLRHQRGLRERLERQPIQFFVREFEALWDDARRSLARFVGAAADDLVFVPNATAGVNTVLRSLRFGRGDELLVTDQEYNACRNALDYVATRSGARVVVAAVPFPVANEEAVVEEVLEKVSRRTRLLLIDHVTSQTGLVLPVGRLVPLLRQRGVLVLIDGAHAPGMLPLNLRKLGADFYTGNCHKWICAPKGAAFLHVRSEHQPQIRPLIISHGANSPRSDRSRFLIEFSWTGTADPTAWLSVPEALRCVGSLLPGGWPAVMRRNRQLALAGRDLLCQALHVPPPCPDSMIGSLAAVPLPDGGSSQVPSSPLYVDPLQDWLLERHRIEVPIIPWPAPPKRLLRISAQLYNSLPQVHKLAKAVTAAIAQTR